jgi:hypothetical protein
VPEAARNRVIAGNLPAEHPFLAPLLRSPADVVECWIGVTDDRDRRVIRLAGRFGEAQVPELLQACQGAGAVTLDLTDLVSADAAGLDALYRIRLRGARMVGASGYIQLRLDSWHGGWPADRSSKMSRMGARWRPPRNRR